MLPAGVVEAMHLKEGDDVEIRLVSERVLEVTRDHNRRRALDQLRAVRRPLPEGWRSDREDSNTRC
jgi:antitoxin MazE